MGIKKWRHVGIEAVGSTVRKTGVPAAISLEREKTLLGRTIGQESGRFSVPAVLGHEEEAGVLEFERVWGLRTLRELLEKRDPRLPGLMDQAASALVAIHDGLSLPQERKVPLGPEWTGPRDVFLHGDFTADNVCICDDADELIIVDWSIARPLGRPDVTHGSIYFDILWFLFFLFRAIPVHWRGYAESLSDRFLQGYASASQETVIDGGAFRNYSGSLVKLQRRVLAEQSARRSVLRWLPFLMREHARLRRWRRYRPAL
jgi:hypothetical protein